MDEFCGFSRAAEHEHPSDVLERKRRRPRSHGVGDVETLQGLGSDLYGHRKAEDSVRNVSIFRLSNTDGDTQHRREVSPLDPLKE